MEEIKQEETIVNTQAATETTTNVVVEEKQTNKVEEVKPATEIKKEAPKAPQKENQTQIKIKNQKQIYQQKCQVTDG